MQNAPREHSAILSTFIKLPFVLKTFVLSIFEWRLKTGLTVFRLINHQWLTYSVMSCSDVCNNVRVHNDDILMGHSGSVGRELDWGLKGFWFKPHSGLSHYVVSLSKML